MDPEILNIDDKKIIRWSEPNKTTPYLDTHEIVIVGNKIIYDVFNSKGEIIKRMDGNETFSDT